MAMFPVVREPIQRFIKGGEGAPKLHRQRWNPTSVLLQVEPPKPTLQVQGGKQSRRKFCSIRFKYKDGADGKVKSKTVFFGDADGQYVGDHDEFKRNKRFIRFQHQQDPFHPNYWRLHLLNTEKTLQEAYISFVRQVLLMRQPVAKVTQAKRK